MISKENKVYEDVHNYTKYKLVEMLIERLKKNKIKLDDLNSIEDLVDEVLETLAISGMKSRNTPSQSIPILIFWTSIFYFQ